MESETQSNSLTEEPFDHGEWSASIWPVVHWSCFCFNKLLGVKCKYPETELILSRELHTFSFLQKP